MNKRGVEEAGPIISVEFLMWAFLSIVVLIALIAIFRQLS